MKSALHYNNVWFARFMVKWRKSISLQFYREYGHVYGTASQWEQNRGRKRQQKKIQYKLTIINFAMSLNAIERPLPTFKPLSFTNIKENNPQ